MPNPKPPDFIPTEQDLNYAPFDRPQARHYNPHIAKVIGVYESMLLHEIHAACRRTAERDRPGYSDRSLWAVKLPHITTRAMNTAFKNLARLGLVTAVSPKQFRPDYNAIAKFLAENPLERKPSK